MRSPYHVEHLACANYCDQTNVPVEIFRAVKGETIERRTDENEFFFIIDGKIDYTTQIIQNEIIESSSIIFIPAGSHIRIQIKQDINALIYRQMNTLHLCGNYSFKKLCAETEVADKIIFSTLTFNEPIEAYLNSLIPRIMDGVRCRAFFNSKYTELLTLLHTYYSRTELVQFFSPALNANTAFTDFIWKNYGNARNVNHFAQMANYSTSHFRAKFREAMGVSASKWMTERKKADIMRDLLSNTKTFKEIAADYHFSSVSHLTTFCREKLGCTPGRIRAKR